MNLGEHKALMTVLRESLLGEDAQKKQQAVDALTDFVHYYCREQYIILRSFWEPPSKDLLCVIDGVVPVYEGDLRGDVRDAVRLRIERLGVKLTKEEWCDVRDVTFTDLPELEVMRLKRIEELVSRAVKTSSAFVSAWEFDSHSSRAMPIDPEAWHKELAILLGLKDHKGKWIDLHEGAGI